MSRIALLCLFVPLKVFSQENVTLEKVRVISDKEISNYNFSHPHVIEEKELSSDGATLITEKLKNIEGVYQSQNGGPGSQTSFFVRGMESRHLLITLDGIKINDSTAPGREAQGAYLPSVALRTLSFYKSPQSVLFGSDSIGGLLALETRKGNQTPETKIQIHGGSYGTIAGTLTQDWQAKNHQGTLSLHRFHTDGISRANSRRYGADEKDSTDITQFATSSKHQWSNSFNTDFLFTYIKNESELDEFGGDSKEAEDRNDQYITGHRTSYSINKNQFITLRNSLNRLQRNVKTTFGDDSYDGNTYQNELNLTSKFDFAQFVIGAANEKQSYNEESLIKEAFELNGLFAQTAFDFNIVKLQFGGRIEKHSEYGSFKTFASGVEGRINSEQRIFTQYSHGYKAPSLYQLYDPTYGNENLKPEMSHAWELGWELKKQSMNLGVTLFQNRLKNVFGSDSNTWRYIQEEGFISEGVELLAQFNIQDFQWRNSWTHQEFRKNATDVLKRPKDMASSSLVYFLDDVSEVALKWRWSSKRKDYGAVGIEELGEFQVFDLGYKTEIKKFEVALTVQNLLGREYEEAYGYSVMPLSVFSTVGYKF